MMKCVHCIWALFNVCQFVYIFLPLLLGKVEAEFLSVQCTGTVEWIVNFGRSRKNPTQPVSGSQRGDKRCLTLPFISPLSTNVMIYKKKNTVLCQRLGIALACDNERDYSVGKDLLFTKVPNILPN